VFVTKLGPTGSSLVYSTIIGPNINPIGDASTGSDIKVDLVGQAYVTGYTFAENFPTTPGAFQQHHGFGGDSNYDAFVLKLSADGNSLEWSTYLGGNSGEWNPSLAIDGSGK